MVVLCFCSFASLAQNVKAKLQVIDVKGKTIVNESKSLSNKLEVLTWYKGQLNKQWSSGYPMANLQINQLDSNEFEAMIFQNDALLIEKISLKQIEEDWQQRLRRIFQVQNIEMNKSNIALLLGLALSELENNGYPFANVWLDSITVKNGNIQAQLFLDKGPYFVFKLFEVDPEVKVSPYFLNRFLGFKPGEPFNYKKAARIDEAISSLPYLEEIFPSEVSFSDEGFVRIRLYLENVQVSSFDGIIGAAPNAAQDGTTLFTGQLDFRLRNPFARGTSFDFAFEKFQESSQKLNSRVEIPFILSSPLGLETKFDLLRVDTLYINVETLLGLNYFFNGSSKLSFYFNQFRAYPLNRSGDNLNRYNDLRTRNYGISYTFQKLDYMPNPLKGLDLNLNGRLGTKTVFELTNEKQTTVAFYQHKIDYYIPLANKLTVMLRNRVQVTYDSSFTQNQVTWVGGLKSIRGFNEGEIPVKNFAQQTIELRYLVDRNSHAKVFYDLALLTQVNQQNAVTQNWYQGLGLGFNFKTGPGIFTINYAIGRAEQSTISLTNGKVHFGFVSYF
jgi:outer membrane translocation and assembly module TamA